MKLENTIALSILALAASCTQELILKLPSDEALKLSIYINDASVSNCAITPGSSRHQALEKWLMNNRGGWKSTPVSYLPGTLVSGPGFTLNFLGSVVIANFAGGQYYRQAALAEVEFLTCE